MDSDRWVKRGVSLCLVMTLIATCSMVTLATSSIPIGELTVSATRISDAPPVMVNGEPASTGRTIFAGSTITTTDAGSAVVTLGTAARLQLAPGTTYVISDAVNGSLTAGSVTLLSGKGLNVRTSKGAVNLGGGEAVDASAAAAAAPAPNKKYGGLYWWEWALITGGVITAVIVAATVSNNDNNNATPTS